MQFTNAFYYYDPEHDSQTIPPWKISYNNLFPWINSIDATRPDNDIEISINYYDKSER